MSASSGLHIRQIADADLPAIAALLKSGFRMRPAGYWLRGLRRQVDRPRPEGTPRYGYLLEYAGKPVGAILLFFSYLPFGEDVVLRCNLSSWFVMPEFRALGPLLVSSAIKNEKITYFNITPTPHTWPIVEAQGFSIYCRGEMLAIPALTRPVDNVTIEIATNSSWVENLPERDLLLQHGKLNCLSLVLRCGEKIHPFIFHRYRIKRVLPTYRLTYCRDMAEFTRFAGNLGRFLLLRRAMPFVLVDANGRVPGLAGIYTEQRGRKYAKGPHIPKLGDLAYSESVFFDA
jgi:hypothetical protein